MLQAFEWYLPDGGKHWERLGSMAGQLKAMGVGGVWLPPCCKATGTNDVGYGVYDLYDLGEFDQKGSVRTKYGTRGELEAAISALHAQGLQVYADVVLNHKAGADETELFQAIRVDPENRLANLAPPADIRGWTRFTFPGRQGKYSPFIWGFQHFTALDYDDLSGDKGIFLVVGENKGFAPNVDSGKGNYDYLMFADVDYRNRDVIGETLAWGEWFIKTLDLDGLRLDALKHINASFISAFLREMRLRSGKTLYCVGEYWHADEELLAQYIGEARDQLALFDVALHYNFVQAAGQGRDYDLRRIFDDTLLSRNSYNVATFVDNHDSQPGQALESWVGTPFKPLAYALILLREAGYPCLFWGDYFGTGGQYPQSALQERLDPLLKARREAAYGQQIDYFDHPNCVGWVRLGDAGRPGSGLAVLMSNGDEGRKRMSLGKLNGGSVWQDITGGIPDRVTLDEEGEAEFRCQGGAVSVYLRA
ncbi:MAG: alpha-amylase [Christensenellales bacterium]